MSSGQGAKVLNSVGSNKAASNTSSQQKKKRPRQRQRPRNKARISNGTANAGESLNASGISDERQTTLKSIVESFNPVATSDCQKEIQVIPNQGAAKANTNLSALTKKVTSTSPKSVEVVNLKIEKSRKEVSSNQTNSVNFESNNLKEAKEQTKEKLTMKPVGVAEKLPENVGKTREEIKAEREAKKLAKQAKKAKALGDTTPVPSASKVNTESSVCVQLVQSIEETSEVNPLSEVITTPINAATVSAEKTRDQIKAEREAKKQAKQAVKSAKKTGVPAITENLAAVSLVNEASTSVDAEKKKPVLSKAERRAIQETQRAAKAQAQMQKTLPSKATSGTPLTKKTTTATAAPITPTNVPKSSSSPVKTTKLKDCKVKLFNHLEKACQDVTLFVNNPHIHPSIARLGEQYAKRTVVGSNARCIAFLNALKMVIKDFETPPKKEFSRSMEATITNCVDYLQKCRPLAVSVSNAYKHIKHMLTQLSTDKPESDLKVNLCRFIDTYIENQIGKAAEAISFSMQEKISNGDVILTFGCSSLINYIFEEAQRRKVDFRVIVVDSRPFCEGQELLRRLAAKEIPCSYVLINAVSFVMPEATKVLLGAHALLANGYVMARTGTAQVALVAHSFNVPVLVCCETHKFSERFQTDAIVYNELGNPDDLILSDKCCLTNWQAKSKMSPLNLMYDITPPELVTAVVTEVSILPCTSVPVILRIKPTEIGYY